MAIRIYRSLEQIQPDPHSVITVGTFDGLHCGHRAIVHELKREARIRHGSTTVVTFDPHPQLVLQQPGKPPVYILTTIEEKISLLRDENIDRLIVIPFTREFSRTSSEVFVRDILFRRAGMQAIVIGHDHGFGKNREGDVATLERMGKELGFAVHKVPPHETEGVLISSTRIREALLRGEVEKAARYLGCPYRLSGAVVRGEGRGQALGFPTANLLPMHDKKLVPAEGVYAVWVERGIVTQNLLARRKFQEGKSEPSGQAGSDSQIYRGMMNIGVRPTFGRSVRVLEVHLIDFSGELYGDFLTVHFIARLRNEQKFDSPQALAEQLHRDKANSMRVLEVQK